ncbi:endonuclease domain-containing protein [Microbacterium lacus]|uniref:endonuclease domain-containing protein n=1 Tax=Microbacterium lacus TaxID=415217 RepID=UPI00384FD5F9
MARILRQILTCQGVEAFFVTLESALRLHKLGSGQLRWLRTRVGKVGRAAIDLARTDADSGLESLLRWRLRAYDVEVRTQVSVVGVGRVDLLIGDRLLVEADGRVNHDGDSHRHKDLVRDAVAAQWGYITLRFDYSMIVHDWELVEQAILTQVALGNHLVRTKVGA